MNQKLMYKRFLAFVMALLMLLTSLVAPFNVSIVKAYDNGEANENVAAFNGKINVFVKREVSKGGLSMYNDMTVFTIEPNSTLNLPDWFLPKFKDGVKPVWSMNTKMATMLDAVDVNGLTANGIENLVITGDTSLTVSYDMDDMTEDNVVIRLINYHYNYAYYGGVSRFEMSDGTIVGGGDLYGYSPFMYTQSGIGELPYFNFREDKGRKMAGYYLRDNAGNKIEIACNEGLQDISPYIEENEQWGKYVSANVFLYGDSDRYKKIYLYVYGTSVNNNNKTYYAFQDTACQSVNDVIPWGDIVNPGYELKGWADKRVDKEADFNSEKDYERYNQYQYGGFVEDYSADELVDTATVGKTYERLFAVWEGYNYKPTEFRAPVDNMYRIRNSALYGKANIGDSVGIIIGNAVNNYFYHITPDLSDGIDYNIYYNGVLPKGAKLPSYLGYATVYRAPFAEDVNYSVYNQYTYFATANNNFTGVDGCFYWDEACTIPVKIDDIVTKDMVYVYQGEYYVDLRIKTLNTTGFIAPAKNTVYVNEETFPDEALRNYLYGAYGSYIIDGKISETYIEKVNSLNLRDTGVKNLKGIEQLPYLKCLACSGTNVGAVDISNNTLLKQLYFDQNVVKTDYNYIDATIVDGFDINRVIETNNCYVDGTKLVIADLTKQASYKYSTGFINLTGYEYWPEICIESSLDGKIDVNMNGLYNKNGEWYYYEKGVVNKTYEGLVPYGDAWFYVNNGKVDFSYTGLAQYEGYWFYVNKGVLDFAYTGLALYEDVSFLCINGQLAAYYTGLYNINNEWYYFVNGCNEKGYEGLVPYGDAWFYVTGGKLDWNYTGLAQYDGYWFYVSNGILDLGYTGLAQYAGANFFVVNGMMQADFTGLVYIDGEWYYIVNGYNDTYYDSLYYYFDNWFYVRNGKVDFSYSGLVFFGDAWFYVNNGVLDFNYSGMVEYCGNVYAVIGGMIDYSFTNLAVYDGRWCCVINGYLDTNFTGFIYYVDRYYLIMSGYVAFDYTGDYAGYNVVNGAVY